MKKIFLLSTILILTILIINSAHAKEAKAYLSLYIINEPPSLTGMSIYGFSDTGLSCNASIEDEHKDFVKLHYYWYKDGGVISSDELLDKGLIKEGDEITCKVVPDDKAQLGSPENITVSVLAEPINLKFNRITGSVIGNINNNKGISLIGLLSFLLIIVIIINVTIIRKSYSPRRVLASSKV